jgi:hypothetical protein
MRKSIIVLSTLALLLIVAFARLPAQGSIESVHWIAPLVNDEHDGYYGAYVAGYQAGSTAEFIISVTNDLYSGSMNVSAIKIWFDWGVNYTDNNPTYNASSPVAIESGLLRVFAVSFDLPDNTVASNLVTHNYRIYVEDVNSTGGLIHHYTYYGSDFAVFSSAQANAWNLMKQIDQYNFYTTFLTSQAKQQLLQAQIALNLGDAAYDDGDFGGAVSYYTNASSLIQNAYSSEYDKSLQFENALLGVTQGAVNMLNMMGIGYTLFGIGFFFMGIGVLVYLVRKSGQRQQQAPPPQ